MVAYGIWDSVEQFESDIFNLFFLYFVTPFVQMRSHYCIEYIKSEHRYTQTFALEDEQQSRHPVTVEIAGSAPVWGVQILIKQKYPIPL